MSKVNFTKEDFESQLWKKISTHLDQRLNSLRVQNDAETSQTETSHLRGRIAEIKLIQGLSKPKPIIE